MQKPSSKLIWNRTEADAKNAAYLDEKIGRGEANAEEKAAYLSERKGSLTETDLNRLEDYTVYLTEKLISFGYLPKIKYRAGAWKKGEGVSKKEMIRIRKNIINLRKTMLEIGLENDFRALFYEDMLCFEKMNDMEFDLSETEKIVTFLEKMMVYAGEIFAGEEWDRRD